MVRTTERIGNDAILFTARREDGSAWMMYMVHDTQEERFEWQMVSRIANLEDKIERGEMVERSSGCCWCIADDIQNKTYIRTDDAEYSFIDAAFCPKCGRRLEDA